MLVKTVFVFLGVMLIVAMIGRAMFPNAIRRKPPLVGKAGRPANCPRCGRFIIGKGPCDCGGNGRRA
jgi:hypothetical protein